MQKQIKELFCSCKSSKAQSKHDEINETKQLDEICTENQSIQQTKRMTVNKRKKETEWKLKSYIKHKAIGANKMNQS